jgi:RNA polymerase sigma factor (sigma-70 family)
MDNPSILTNRIHDLLNRMNAGDANAASDLLRIVGERLEKLARRMLRNYPQVRRWAETDDVLQSALVRLLRALESVRPQTSRDFFNLAAVQIRRELIDLARHYQGKQGMGAHHDSIGSGIGDIASDTPANDADLDAWQAFHQEVEKLPADEREVVSLIYYHGWEQKDVADLFQVTPRTVRRWWTSALGKLHGVFQDLPGE